MKAALVQMTASDDPQANLETMCAAVREGAALGADLILTPEVCNCVSLDRERQAEMLRTEAKDATLAGLRDEARAVGCWLLIGSLALKTGDADGRFANRSFLIGPDGGIAARYDKIHMFDVDLGGEESFRESAGYRPGARAVLADTSLGRIGMTVCYDLRFPHMFRRLAQAGAEIITVPAAFSPVTGAAHWEVLLRARAIETGCFILAPAQTGRHRSSTEKVRTTWGHSLAVAPWGEVLADAGTAPGVTLVDLDLARVGAARGRVPSLLHDRDFSGPGI
jgi:predicted amidohydrolase